MNKLDIKEIVKNAIDGSTYSKAYDLFLNKKIVLKCRRNEQNEDVYEGIVTGNSNKSYHVMVIIDTKGKVVKATCECDFYLKYVGYCKHILAFLLQINEITNRKETNELTALLNYYKKSVSLDINVKPIFHLFDQDVGVELKIGKEKKYIIKNIPEFVENIDKNLSFKYGKDLEFVHSMNAFDKYSRNIIEDLYEYINYYPGENKSYFDGKRKVKIPKIIFKKILDMFLDQEVEFFVNEAHYDLFYCRDVINIELLFSDNTLSIKDRKKICIFSIGQSYYAIKDDKLYCLDNLKNQDVIPLLNTLYQKEIKFNSKSYNEFFTYIYPRVQDDLTIINKEFFVANNNCSTLDVACYLDLKNSNLYLTYKFYYQGMDREEAVLKGIYPNTAQEENFLEQLTYFNFMKTTKENEFVIDDQDIAIDFLKNDIDKLKEYAKVYVSDKIKNINFKKSNGTGIGVRYSTNWLSILFDDKEFPFDELENILKDIELKKKYHLLKDGTVLNISDKNFLNLYEIIDTIGYPSKKIEKEIDVPIFKIVQLEGLLDNKSMPKEAERFLYCLRNYKNIRFPLKPSLEKILRDYQKEGYRWLANLANYRLGGILADDMGLGKSLQIITMINSFDTAYPNLIVSPASLTYNWYNEFKKWTPECNVLLISGNGTTRENLINNIKMGQTIITSYDYLKRDIELYKKFRFHFMIIDEAQNIKNFATKNAETVKEIKAISKFALTGTPIENTLADLWSIFDYCLPGYLKSYEKFKNEYEYEIVRNNDKDLLLKLNKQISPFILRRTKKDVLRELPEKFEQIVYAKMEDEQEKLYKATINETKENLIKNSSNKIYIFTMLTRLRQICCHPNLFVNNYKGDSAKLNLTIQLVEDSISANHRILIFSQFTTMLDILKSELEKRNIKHFVLTGNTSTDKRFELVDEFNKNEEIKVFLISLKAGGTGLNLVGADMVIHYDPWWNLSAENQASDRVHRIGQKRNVQIIKIITKDSIEEKILDLQLKKKELFSKVVEDENTIVSKLTNEELLNLFN